MRLLVLFCALTLLVPAASRADDERTDVSFALLKYAGGNWNPRPQGLPRLAWELRKRTSIAIGLETAIADPNTDSVFEHPLIAWQGDSAFPPLRSDAVTRLRQHLAMGGTLLVDASDGAPDGPFHRS